MMYKQHIILSLPAAAAFYLVSKDIVLSIIFFAAAILIDSDHVFDYLTSYRKWDTRHFLQGGWFKDKLYVLFHSIEIIIALFIVFIFNQSLIAISVALGLLFHIILDWIDYRSKAVFYFLTYRAFHRFDTKVFCNG